MYHHINYHLKKRISEASMAFTKNFWQRQKYDSRAICSEATQFLENRVTECQEISWEDILVSLLHSSNTSDKITVTDKPNGCHYGF